MNEMPLARKSVGQHWLTDLLTLQAIADAAEIKADDTVLEIGPGSGTLTRLLVKQAGQVIAVELDERLIVELRKNIRAENLQIEQGNILKFDLTKLPTDYKVVANIPYYLTSNLLRNMSETTNKPKRMVLLVQKEVAERVAAGPGKMSLLSVTTQLYWDVSLGIDVPAKMFTPVPKVNSQVLICIRRDKPLFPDIDETAFFRLVRVGFAARRKTLLNSLAGGLRIEKKEVEKLLLAANVSADARPQTLSLQDWYRIFIHNQT